MTKPTVSTASSATSAVSPSPRPPPSAASSGARAPPSMLPVAQSTVPKSMSGETPSSKSTSVSVSGSGKSWGEGTVGKGELPSLLAPVDLHARDAEGVGHQVRKSGEAFGGLGGWDRWIEGYLGEHYPEGGTGQFSTSVVKLCNRHATAVLAVSIALWELLSLSRKTCRGLYNVVKVSVFTFSEMSY